MLDTCSSEVVVYVQVIHTRIESERKHAKIIPSLQHSKAGHSSSITFRRISQTPSSITIHEICRVLSRML
ncbi:hypothetical protein BST61_g10407 [Cercospora zeina]